MLIHIPWANHVSDLHAVKKVYLLVDLFFVLSGFVLTVVYRNDIGSRDELCRFLTLRLFRIYPLHVAVLMILLGLETVKAVAVTAGLVVPTSLPFTGNRSITSFFEHLLLLQGSGVVSSSWNAPSWSIGCEAVAYVLFGVGTFCGLVKGRAFVLLAVALSIVCYGIVLELKRTLGVMFDLGLLRCIAGFSLGCAVAVVVQSAAVESGLNATSSRVLSAVTLALFAMGAYILSTADGYDEVTIIPVFVALVGLLQCDRGIVARVLQTRVFAFLGLISYSLYMINYPIFMTLDFAFKRWVSSWQIDIGRLPGDGLLAVVVIAIVLAAWASFEWIEAPGRALGRRLAQPERQFYRKRLATATSPTSAASLAAPPRVAQPQTFDNNA
jgi:peptidoglycan/LPS O-acetylase OafA/YrhL